MDNGSTRVEVKFYADINCVFRREIYLIKISERVMNPTRSMCHDMQIAAHTWRARVPREKKAANVPYYYTSSCSTPFALLGDLKWQSSVRAVQKVSVRSNHTQISIIRNRAQVVLERDLEPWLKKKLLQVGNWMSPADSWTFKHHLLCVLTDRKGIQRTWTPNSYLSFPFKTLEGKKKISLPNTDHFGRRPKYYHTPRNMICSTTFICL